MPRKEAQTWETERAQFPTRLSEIMKEKKVSQETLASAIGVKRQTVSLYKTGQSSPNVEQLRKIATFFEVSSDWLLGLTNDKSKQPRTADILGISSSALDNLLEISEAFPGILQDVLSSGNYLMGFIIQIYRLKHCVSDIKKAHEVVHKDGLCENHEKKRLFEEFETMIGEFLGYPVSFVEPHHAIYGQLDSVKISAENLAKEISGYNDLSSAELFDHIIDFEPRDIKAFSEYIMNRRIEQEND